MGSYAVSVNTHASFMVLPEQQQHQSVIRAVLTSDDREAEAGPSARKVPTRSESTDKGKGNIRW